MAVVASLSVCKRGLESDVVEVRRPQPSPARAGQRRKIEATTPKEGLPVVAEPTVCSGPEANTRVRPIVSAIMVQPFSLLSRKYEGLLAGDGDAPAELKLLTPQRLQGSVHLGCAVQCCNCSWKQLGQRRERRLCQQDTEEHAEYQLLREMNTSFVHDCQERAMHFSTTTFEHIVKRACVRDAEVHFLIDDADAEAEAPEVVGYAAIVCRFEHRVPPNAPGLTPELVTRVSQMPCKVPLLEQFFVESARRRQGVATIALPQLLSPHESVAVEAPNRLMSVALERAGFQFVGARAGEMADIALFVRKGEA